MRDGWHEGELVGSGTVIWRSRRKLAAGEISEEEFLDRACDSAPSAGHCNTMGTASTMNSIAEGLGMSLPGGAMIPARSEEHTSELQSLMRISYAVFCLKKKKIASIS